MLLPAASVFAWVGVSLYGIQHASLLLSLSLWAVYAMWCVPLLSSFRHSDPQAHKAVSMAQRTFTRCLPRLLTSAAGSSQLILGRVESCVLTLCLLFLPALVHLGVFHRVLLSDPMHVCNLLLAICLPPLQLRALMHKEPLWWTGAHTHTPTRSFTQGHRVE